MIRSSSFDSISRPARWAGCWDAIGTKIGVKFGAVEAFRLESQKPIRAIAQLPNPQGFTPQTIDTISGKSLRSMLLFGKFAHSHLENSIYQWFSVSAVPINPNP